MSFRLRVASSDAGRLLPHTFSGYMGCGERAGDEPKRNDLLDIAGVSDWLWIVFRVNTVIEELIADLIEQCDHQMEAQIFSIVNGRRVNLNPMGAISCGCRGWASGLRRPQGIAFRMQNRNTRCC